MGILDKFKKKRQPQFMNDQQFYNGYPNGHPQQQFGQMQRPFGMRPPIQQFPNLPDQRFQQQPYQPYQTTQAFQPQFQQLPYGQNPRYHYQPYIQNYGYQQPQYNSYQQQPYSQNFGYQQQSIPQQQAITSQPQLNAYQQYVNDNKLLQSVPYQDQPTIQAHNGGQMQSQYPMTGQPPERDKNENNPGFLSRMLGGDTSITGIIDNMQRAVQTAQNVTPMISQYSPLVKNFPSLFKIFKEVNTDDPIDVKNNKEKTENVASESKKKRKTSNTLSSEIIDIEPIPMEENNRSEPFPKPKLFT